MRHGRENESAMAALPVLGNLTINSQFPGSRLERSMLKSLIGIGLNTGNRYCACNQKNSILNFGKRWLPEKMIDKPIKQSKARAMFYGRFFHRQLN